MFRVLSSRILVGLLTLVGLLVGFQNIFAVRDALY